MKVYLLQDDLYETTLSLHKAKRGAQQALETYVNGEATERAKRWWASFGGDSEFVRKYGHEPKSATLEEHLANELACVRENLRIEERTIEP